MGLACSLGSHSWNGCICTKCGKTRDEGHDWAKDCEKCSRCNKTRSNVHNWDGCKCTKCAQVREKGHQYVGCKCARCGRIRDDMHSWLGDTCQVCGSPKSAAQLWAEGMAKAGNFQELALIVSKYKHELKDPQDQQRRIYAREALLASGAPAFDAVAGMITQPGVDPAILAEYLYASHDRRAALPLLSQFDHMSFDHSFVERMIGFFFAHKAVEVVPGLEVLLQNKSSGTRYLAAMALGKLGIDGTVEPLLKALDGDPNVLSGLKDARTVFAQSILKTFDERRKASAPNFETMSEEDMLKIMQSFASAYLRDDKKTRDQLELTAKDIGAELNRRGGEAAMQKMIQNFQGPAVRHIDLIWNGIGSWQG